MTLFSYLKSQLPILDVIGQYLNVRRMGNYWKGSCPFHRETDASFTISPEKQMFYCFGCHASGDVISFVAKLENMSQYEAAQHLIELHRITVPKEILAASKNNKTSSDFQAKDRYFFICDRIAEYIREQLSASAIAKNYLAGRGVLSATIERFSIGYLPGGSKAIFIFIETLSKRGVLLKELIEHGIVFEGRGHYYSPFEERIIFPITDQLGRFCGFGGRIFRPNDDRSKYYNSKDSPYFSKGKLLYGLHMAKESMHARESAVLVEGYLDAVLMAQHGFTNVVATLGTACTLDHLQTIARHVRVLYVLYDGDSAGRKAALRLAELCWETSLELMIALLPAGDDPASLLARGGDVAACIAAARDICSFMVASVGDSFHRKTLSEKFDAARQLLEVLVRVSDPLKRDLLLQRAALVMGVPFAMLREQAGLLIRRTKPEVSVASDLSGERGEESLFASLSPLEQQIISAILISADSSDPLVLPDDMVSYFASSAQIFIQQVRHVLTAAEPRDRVARIVSDLSAADRAWVERVLVTSGGRISAEEFDHYVTQLRRAGWRQTLQKMQQEIEHALLIGDRAMLSELMQGVVALQQEIKRRGLL